MVSKPARQQVIAFPKVLKPEKRRNKTIIIIVTALIIVKCNPESRLPNAAPDEKEVRKIKI
jgi:hypothetical protein